MADKKPRKLKVYWTYEEKQLLTEAAAKRKVKDPEKSILKIMQLVQREVLPVERRKVLLGIANVGQATVDAIVRRVAELKDGGVTTMRPSPKEESPHPDPLYAYTTAELVAELLDRVLVPISRMDRVLARIAATSPIQVRSWHAPSSPSPTQATEMEQMIVDQAEPPRPPRGPCISIVGYLEGQQRSIRDALDLGGVVADVRFLDKDTSDTTFPASTEFVIVEKHTQHCWWEAAGKLVGNQKRYFVHGTSGAVRIIKKIVEGSNK